METFRLLDTGHLSAAANMALDQIILEETASGNSPFTLRFLQFQPAAALVGYNQDVAHEIRQEFCELHGIEVNRRITGGGSIYFQESALGWEIFGTFGKSPFCGGFNDILEGICRAAAASLNRLGLDAHFRPRNDIEINGKKIGGTGGVTFNHAFMFQGTILIKNETELFLKALKVPVEKLKKREIESLLERICFLNDLTYLPDPLMKTKAAFAAEFAERFDIKLIPGELTELEQRRLSQELPYYESDNWISRKSERRNTGHPLRAVTQTDAGTLRVHLWLTPNAKRITKALIVGDFFAIPSRMINDLEAELAGAPTETEGLTNHILKFIEIYDGQLLGITPIQIAGAITGAADRRFLLGRFEPNEINDIFFINSVARTFGMDRPEMLLLPYCSKKLDCDFRNVPGCAGCGECEIGELYLLAEEFGLEPVTIQSFEHLMGILRNKCVGENRTFLGSCCEAFYAKHQQEMKSSGAQGILVNLDSTTCYDLGKGTPAYRGNFDNQTNLNRNLIEKTLRLLHAR